MGNGTGSATGRGVAGSGIVAGPGACGEGNIAGFSTGTGSLCVVGATTGLTVGPEMQPS